MDSSYEIEPEPIGRATDRRRPMVAVVVGLVVVAAVLAKPWDPPAAPPQTVGPTAAPVVAAASPEPSVIDPRPVTVAPVVGSGWPAALVATDLALHTAEEARGALGPVAARAGTWGVGNAGVGPRLLREEAWSDWAPVAVEVVDDAPVHVATWPGTDLCAGYPAIYDRPTIVAVTTPDDVAPDRVLRGWWTDGARVASLAGSIVGVSSRGDGGISYLERVDRAPWPPGRYEFHVAAGERSVSLTVCLTRRG